MPLPSHSDGAARLDEDYAVAMRMRRESRDELMPDGSPRSGMSQAVMTEIVRERRDAIVERDRYRQALEAIVRGGGRTMPTYQWAAKTAREALHAA